MTQLIQFCNEANNNADHCQARVLRYYLIAQLLGGDTNDVRFYDANGNWFRHASFR